MIDYQAYEKQLIIEDEDGKILEQNPSSLSLDDLAFTPEANELEEPMTEDITSNETSVTHQAASVAITETESPVDDNFSYEGQSAWLSAEFERQQGLRQQGQEDGQHDLPTRPHGDLVFAQGVNQAKQQNFYAAAQNFRQAAMTGHGKAQFYLGLLFFKGQGVPSSPVHALCWLTLASCQNVKPANLAIEMLQGQINQAQRQKAAEMAADKMEAIWATH